MGGCPASVLVLGHVIAVGVLYLHLEGEAVKGLYIGLSFIRWFFFMNWVLQYLWVVLFFECLSQM